jgi:hypothetical protein
MAANAPSSLLQLCKIDKEMSVCSFVFGSCSKSGAQEAVMTPSENAKVAVYKCLDRPEKKEPNVDRTFQSRSELRRCQARLHRFVQKNGGNNIGTRVEKSSSPGMIL